MRRRRPARGSALVVAIVALALGGALAAVLAELTRVTVVQVRHERDGTRAWFLAEAALAETVAALEPDVDLEALPERPVGPAGRGWVGRFVEAHPGRVRLQITAFDTPPVRRRLEAVLARAADPHFPGAVTLDGGLARVPAGLWLDGRDFTARSACARRGDGRDGLGVALGGDGVTPLVEPGGRVRGRGGEPSLGRTAVPDLAPLTTATGARRPRPGLLDGALGNVAAPALSVVPGDAYVGHPVDGAGILVVDGRLTVASALRFVGVVAATAGLSITSTGTVEICGGLWARGDPAVDARGGGTVRMSRAALRRAAELAPLPAPVVIVATRELS